MCVLSPNMIKFNMFNSYKKWKTGINSRLNQHRDHSSADYFGFVVNPKKKKKVELVNFFQLVGLNPWFCFMWLQN